ncbi:MAG TPA: hypothetical protein VHG31_04945 [Stellaceae bacterium]|nr:hypothetical protein [Stellaceae bacterium]
MTTTRAPAACRQHDHSRFPQLRFAALTENGTHVLFGARLGPYAEGETTLVLAALQPDILCLANRQFFGHALYHERWEIEGALAKLKTQPRGARLVLRSKIRSWSCRSSGVCCWRISSCAGSCMQGPALGLAPQHKPRPARLRL